MKKGLLFFNSIYFKIPMLFIFILLISFQFIGVYFIDQLQLQSVANFKENWNTQSNILINNVRPVFESEASQSSTDEPTLEFQLNQILSAFSTDSSSLIQILDNEGYVRAINQSGLSNTVGHKVENKEALSVLSNKQSYAQEYHDYGRKNRSYSIIQPILSQDESKLLGAVMLEVSMNSVYNQTTNVMGIFVQSAAVAIGVAVVIAFFLSQAIIGPIDQIRQQALRISDGIYNYPAEVFGEDELGELSKTVNELAIKVRDGQDSIESERQRLDGVLRHMNDGVIGTDRRGSILLINERALELLGLRQNEALGISILDILNLKETHRLTQLYSGESEVMIEPDSETILKGEISVIRRETGFVNGLVCVLTDITGQEKTERERREFVSNVSHELRTPLTSVKSYSDALIDGAWQDEKIAPQFLSVIQSETNRMIRMIGNLLELSKIDGGQIKPQMEVIDFKRIVSHILDRLEFTLDSDTGETSKKYRIIRDFTRRDLYLELDQDRMTQVIDNIMSNAIKYSPDGGAITVTIMDNPDSIVLSISDEGLGIPQKDLSHLFKRFYRVDKARSREQGGTGLGLAISKEVVEMHGGKIWAESEENVGSTFFVQLPYTPIEFDLEDEGWDE